jgi:SAM-dependent methyltransferase
MSVSSANSHDSLPHHTTVISNRADRRLFFALRSCEVVGSRSEKSLFDFSCEEDLRPPTAFFFTNHKSPVTSHLLMTFTDAKQRFSTRVADYVRYRPGYPSAIRDVLRTECGLRPGHVITDVGSGTGFLSELFLKNGNRVFGVEPNEAMREAGEEYLASFDGFTSVNGSAEATTLDDSSVDFVTTGQAFHWFDQNAARLEFSRILKPAGWVVVVWNERRTDANPFVREYENILRTFGTDYERVKESYPTADHMRDFYGTSPYASRSLPNFQEFDFEGLAGRLRSSSFIPTPDAPNFAPMMAELRRIFDAHNQAGRVRLEYSTHIYFGRLNVPVGSGEIAQDRNLA